MEAGDVEAQPAIEQRSLYSDFRRFGFLRPECRRRERLKRGGVEPGTCQPRRPATRLQRGRIGGIGPDVSVELILGADPEPGNGELTSGQASYRGRVFEGVFMTVCSAI